MLAESDELVTHRWPLPTAPVTRTEQPCPFQWRPCSTVIGDHASSLVLAIFGIYKAGTVLGNLHEAYGEAEKRFGEKHIMSYHNQVCNTKPYSVVCFYFGLLKHDQQ